MQQSDIQEFTQALSAVLSFYKQDISPFAMGVWWQACERYDIDQVRKAFARHALDPDRGQFPPKPADLARMLEGTSGNRALIAWGKAIEAAQRAGAYSDVCFDDPAIHATIEDCGGWPKFCRTQTAELSYLQHRFCETHRTYAAQETFEFPRCLAGDRSPDDVFAKRGLKPPKPILIGDTAKAQQVYQLGVNRSQRSAVSTLHALDAAAATVTALIDNPPAAVA